MHFDDKISLPEDTSIYLDFEVTSHIRRNYPEFFGSGSRVSVQVIKLIDEAYYSVMGDDVEDCVDEDDFIDDHEAKEILNNLPVEVHTKPLSPDIVSLIIDEMDELAHLKWKQSVEDERDLECFVAEDYGVRARARAATKHFKEALEDFNQACLLEPDNLSLFLGRANLFLEMELKGLALKDAIYVYEEKGDNFFKNFTTNFPELTDIFHKCGKPTLAIESLLKFLRMANGPSLLPYLTFEDYYFVVEKDGYKTSLNIEVFNEIISIVKGIELENVGDFALDALIESVKSEIVFLRKIVGF
jgi:tetratricopeptide (TPR) repeat protein